jgi:hypothetical protein
LTKRPFKIGVAGTHSTGKSTFVRCVDEALAAEGMAIAKVNDLATRASALGSIALGEGRDTDEGFRAAADRHVTAVMKEFAPHAVVMTADDAPRIIHDAIALARKGGARRTRPSSVRHNRHRLSGRFLEVPRQGVSAGRASRIPLTAAFLASPPVQRMGIRRWPTSPTVQRWRGRSARRFRVRCDRDEAPRHFSLSSAEPNAKPIGLALGPASHPSLLCSDDPRQMISPITPRLLAVCPQEGLSRSRDLSICRCPRSGNRPCRPFRRLHHPLRGRHEYGSIVLGSAARPLSPQHLDGLFLHDPSRTALAVYIGAAARQG